MSFPHTPEPPRPPRLAQLLITMALPTSEREALLGDLQETFAHRTTTHGRTAAALWYWGQVVATPLRVVSGLAYDPTVNAHVRRSRRAPFADLGTDLRLGARRASQRPLAMASAIVVLSLAVGGSTALTTALLRFSRWDPGVPAPESISALAVRTEGRTRNRHDAAMVTEVKRALAGARVAAITHRFAVARTDLGAATIWSGVATSSFFDTIGVSLQRGRAFAAVGDEAVVSDRFWRNRMGGREDALGAVLWLNGRPLTVVGITSPDFHGLAGRPSLWVSLEALPLSERDALSVAVLVRGGDPGQLAASGARIAAMLTDRGSGQKVEAVQWIPASEIWVPRAEGALVNRANVTMSLLALLILAAACANVTNLLLADGLSRRAELELRAAIGASRLRLLRQLVAESATLASGVCVGSYLVARALLAAIPRWLPTPIPGFEQRFEIPYDILAGALVLAVTSTLAASILPAMSLSRRSASVARVTTSRRMRTLETIGATQVAAAVALMLMGLFLARGMNGIHDLPLGYQEQDRYSFTLDASALPADPDLRAAAYRRFFALLAESPAVVAAGVANAVPGFLLPSSEVRADGAVEPVPSGAIGVGTGYLDAVGTRLIEGRAPRADDAGRDVVLVSQALALSLWGSQSPLGKLVHRGEDDAPLRVIGVVEDGTYAGPSTLPVIMRPLPAPSGTRALVIVHARGDSAELVAALYSAAENAHADMSLHSLAPVSEWFDRHWVLERAVGAGMQTLALLGLAISGIGVYAGFSTIVARRRGDIGIRLAIGAKPVRLLREVLRDSTRVALYGYAAGAALSVAGSRLLQAYLFDAGPGDPIPYVIGIAITLALTTSATLLPALRAASVDPLLSLRSE